MYRNKSEICERKRKSIYFLRFVLKRGEILQTCQNTMKWSIGLNIQQWLSSELVDRPIVYAIIQL